MKERKERKQGKKDSLNRARHTHSPNALFNVKLCIGITDKIYLFTFIIISFCQFRSITILRMRFCSFVVSHFRMPVVLLLVLERTHFNISWHTFLFPLSFASQCLLFAHCSYLFQIECSSTHWMTIGVVLFSLDSAWNRTQKFVETFIKRQFETGQS